MSKDKTPKGTGTPGDAEEWEVTYEAEPRDPELPIEGDGKGGPDGPE